MGVSELAAALLKSGREAIISAGEFLK
jgi:hypothetical protein